MKKLLLAVMLIVGAGLLNAQITIMDGSIQEKIVSRPHPFDSLSNITCQTDPMQYKQYIGYKLFCLPLSTKFKCKYSDCTVYEQNFKQKTLQTMEMPHAPFAQTDVAKMFGDIKKLKGNALAQYKTLEADYENSYKVTTDIYKPMFSKHVPNQHKYYTPFECIQNTYYTILNIEISESQLNPKFCALDEFENTHKSNPNSFYLRFTLKNETSGEELYWFTRSSDLPYSVMFLVPYFEKMQQLYKGHNVVPTTEFANLVDINTGDAVTIHPKEVWTCYDVTFVNLKEEQWIKPFFFIEREGVKVKIKFEDFSKECNGIFTQEDRIHRPMFMLEDEFNEIVAEKERAIEEQKRIEEEKLRAEEEARKERNKQIMQKYGNRLGTLICNGQVCLNMTKEMCRAAWGEPISINSTIVQGAVYEQWVYDWQTYLYFDNGILKAIQE